MPNRDRDAAALAQAVLDAEADRQREHTDAQPAVLPDDLLPGVGGAPRSLRDILRTGGVSTVLVLGLLNLVDDLDRVALAVLAPDIQRSLDISDAAIGAVAGVGGLVFVLGAIPLGFLGDRVRRTWLVAVSSAACSAFAVLTGLVQNLVQLVATRMGNGLGKANVLPVHNSLLSDRYPIEGRSRIFALHGLANPIGVVLGPLLAGGIVALAGGPEAWRWVFVLLAIPGLVLAAIAFFLPEPPRGGNEQIEVLGERLAPGDELPIPLDAGFERLLRIRTFHFLLLGVGVLGFALFSVPTFLNLLLEDRYGLSTFRRGVYGSLAHLGGLVGIPLGGYLGDKLFRRHPPKAVLMIGAAVGAYGVVFTLSLYAPNLPVLLVGLSIAYLLSGIAFVPMNSLIAAVAPYRMRSLAFAMVGIYIFFFGAFFGGIITGAISDSLGERAALTIVIPPTALLGGALIAYGARFIRSDISLVVEELREEQEEQHRLRASPELIPVLQIRNLDFSYGPVQVLFDVSLDIQRGETVALLGTNGAGKSTVLRAVSGLSMPHRGVVRLDGRTITYTSAETRVGLGIVQVPGGAATFGDLTVEENLLAGAYGFVWDHDRVLRRTNHVLELFPELRDHLGDPAATLSGGEQQMVALAKALMLEPEILLIDELSLGLAPIVVERMLTTVERLKSEGMTMLIVEQSVNVALSIADRAVFMEKGRVQFVGDAAELLQRDDLLRAVFLGGVT